MHQYCCYLLIGFQVFRACHDMALAATYKEGSDAGASIAAGKKQAWDSRAPLSVAAAIVYTITLLCKVRYMPGPCMVSEMTPLFMP